MIRSFQTNSKKPIPWSMAGKPLEEIYKGYEKIDCSVTVAEPVAKIKYISGVSLIEEPIKPMTHPTNCVNCGAVLKTNKCEYCGTEYL